MLFRKTWPITMQSSFAKISIIKKGGIIEKNNSDRRVYKKGAYHSLSLKIDEKQNRVAKG